MLHRSVTFQCALVSCKSQFINELHDCRVLHQVVANPFYAINTEYFTDCILKLFMCYKYGKMFVCTVEIKKTNRVGLIFLSSAKSRDHLFPGETLSNKAIKYSNVLDTKQYNGMSANCKWNFFG